jgi:hypothetical protein
MKEFFRRLWRREPALPPAFDLPKMEPYHIMLDLETLGLYPGCTVLRIGAVRFTLDGKILDEFECGITKYSCDDVGLVAEDSALKFWADQTQEAQNHLYAQPMYELSEALLRFNAWIRSYEKGYLLGIWGNGAAFDQPIINAAYRAIDSAPAWTYKQEFCYRTIKEMNRDVPYPEFKGVQHNALDDARNQTEHLQRIYKQKGRL